MPDTLKPPALPISFFVPGIPKAQPRPRACRRGKHAGVYDAGTADSWKAMVATAALATIKHDHQPIDWPVQVDIVWIMPRPKSHFDRSGLLKRSAPFWYAAKPDRDNLDKAVLDALVHWRILTDDSFVVYGVLAKRYASPNEPTGARIAISNPGMENIR